MATRSRRRFDDDDYLPTSVTATSPDDLADPATIEEPCWSNYPDAVHGPAPTPEWVITSPGATDTDLGVMKTGKEADVSLIRREFEGRATMLAVKQYRDAKHRMFHRDAGYLEGRRMRRSRENRAMATRTGFGRELIAGQWAAAEFAVLSRLWRAGAAVPYPVQLDGTELAMEFIGDHGDGHGVAAPRLAELRPDHREANNLYGQLREALLILAEAGNFPDVASYFCTHIDVRGRELFIRTLRRGVESGEFRPLPDLEATAIIVSQPLAMFSVWKRSLAPFDPDKVDDDRFYTAYLDFVLKGLRP